MLILPMKLGGKKTIFFFGGFVLSNQKLDVFSHGAVGCSCSLLDVFMNFFVNHYSLVAISDQDSNFLSRVFTVNKYIIKMVKQMFVQAIIERFYS